MAKTMSIIGLRKALAAKERQLTTLQTQRQKIAKQLASIDDEIAALGGEPVKGKRKARRKASKKIVAKRVKRTKRGQSLADVLAEVLVGKGNVKVAEAAKLAVGAGYKSKSRQFGNVVSQTLSVDKRFKKIARGVYVLKGGKSTPAKRTTKKVAEKTARTGKKAGTQKSLGSLLAEVAKGRESLAVADAAKLVLEKGYKSRTKNFHLAVNKALMRDERFGRVSRGVYTLKG